MLPRASAPLLLALLTAACAKPHSPPAAARRAALSAAPEGATDRALYKAESRARRHPRRVQVWRDLRRAALRAQQPHRYLRALEATEARGRLPRELRADLATGLRQRAAELAALGAPDAAHGALLRARQLAPPPPASRDALADLADRVELQRADRWLRTEDLGRARKAYQALAARGVLAAAALKWRRAATDQLQHKGNLAEALRRLGDRAPSVSRRLAQRYLTAGGRDPAVLLAALDAVTHTRDKQLAAHLDRRLSRVASQATLATACRLRRRPGSPSCKQLQRWATTRLDALARWAALCRALHWPVGNARWLGRALGLLATDSGLGLGPLAGLVDRALASKTVVHRKKDLALLRAVGLGAALRRSLTTTAATLTLDQLAELVFDAWLEGHSAQADRALARLARGLGASGSANANPGRRCRLVRLTRLVRGPAEAHQLSVTLASTDPGLRRRLVSQQLRRGELARALHLAPPSSKHRVHAHLRALGQTLVRWGVHKDATLRTHWSRVLGIQAAQQAWSEVERGARSATLASRSSLVRLLRLAAQGRLPDAEAVGRRRLSAGNLSPEDRRRWQQARLWLAHLRGDRVSLALRLRQLRHRSPGGVTALPVLMSTLSQLGLGREAGRLADALYERTPTDPVLLRLVAQGAVASRRWDKARLALTDWAAALGRPDLAYLALGRFMARHGQHQRAAALAGKALPWSGLRPLRATLDTLVHQWTAKRSAEARRTADWLLGHWPRGPARDGVSQTLALRLQRAGHHGPAQRYLLRAPGHGLQRLLEKRPAEVQRRASARARLSPLAGHWHALAALAALRRRRPKAARAHVAQLVRRAPRSAPLARALLAAGQGQLRAALAWLALAAQADARAERRLLWFGAALASKAGQRPLAARLASAAATAAGGPLSAADLGRLTPLARGRPLPVKIPWDMLRRAPRGAGSCEP